MSLLLGEPDKASLGFPHSGGTGHGMGCREWGPAWYASMWMVWCGVVWHAMELLTCSVSYSSLDLYIDNYNWLHVLLVDVPVSIKTSA
jgi:hypothetical protein